MQSTIKVTLILLVIFIIGTLYFSIGKNTNYDTKNLVGKKLTEIRTEKVLFHYIKLRINKFFEIFK